MVNTAATAMAPNRQDFTVDLTVTKAFGSGAPNSLTVGVGMEMLGPGDVLGLAPGQVIRTEPADRATGVETTLFPSVEFAEPALPWLLTPGPENAGWPGGPAPPPGGHQLLPWICLVVVPDTDGITLDTSAGRLTIAARADARQQLPDLREAWAWAHVQYAGDLDADATGSGGQPRAGDGRGDHPDGPPGHNPLPPGVSPAARGHHSLLRLRSAHDHGWVHRRPGRQPRPDGARAGLGRQLARGGKPHPAGLFQLHVHHRQRR